MVYNEIAECREDGPVKQNPTLHAVSTLSPGRIESCSCPMRMPIVAFNKTNIHSIDDGFLAASERHERDIAFDCDLTRGGQLEDLGVKKPGSLWGSWREGSCEAD